jgi:hypothetical protein
MPRENGDIAQGRGVSLVIIEFKTFKPFKPFKAFGTTGTFGTVGTTEPVRYRPIGRPSIYPGFRS